MKFDMCLTSTSSARRKGNQGFLASPHVFCRILQNVAVGGKESTGNKFPQGFKNFNFLT